MRAYEEKAFEPIFETLLPYAHKAVQPPNNIDKLSFYARRVECNCNCTQYFASHYGIRCTLETGDEE